MSVIGVHTGDGHIDADTHGALNSATTLRDAHEGAQGAYAASQGGAERRAVLEQERRAARERARALWQDQTRRESTRAEAESLAAPLAKAEAEVTKRQKDSDGYSVLYDAFRPSGIPARIIAGVVEELNEEANDILGHMGSNLGVNVSTQRETQKGTTMEQVRVYATTADGHADYATLSGQEKFFIALSLRLALTRCVARRTGTPIQTIILDEGWGNLDERHKRAVQEALTRISAEFSIFTVTHIEDVQDAFPTVIRVDAGAGTSRVEVTTR